MASKAGSRRLYYVVGAVSESPVLPLASGTYTRRQPFPPVPRILELGMAPVHDIVEWDHLDQLGVRLADAGETAKGGAVITLLYEVIAGEGAPVGAL